MINIINKADCCGCTACAGICPKQCITMKEDAEGFVYPSVRNDECVDCGACERVCPILNQKEKKAFKQRGFIVQNKDRKVLRESTAGGAFTAIAKYIIGLGGVVFGVELSKDLSVRHVRVEKEEELFRFRNSKYVQSYIGRDVFHQVKSFLEEGRYVCFSGTPCQIEGLKGFLGKEYSNLIAVDVVCHAVPSPLIFRKYVECQENSMDAKIQTLYFRDKHFGYKYSTMNLVTDRNHGNYHKGVESDPWLRAFLSNICDRPSCYQCRFKNRYRISDFTIWDCFPVGRFSKDLDNDRGATRVLVHTEKGQSIFSKISEEFHYVEVDPEELTAGAKEMFESVEPHEKRQQFFEDAIQLNGTQLFEKYFPVTMKVKAERMIRILCYKLGIYSVAKKLFVRVTHKY